MRTLYQAALACVLGTHLSVEPALAQSSDAAKEPTGKQLAFDNRKGNCLACHGMPTVPDALATGLYGPPLIAMSARFPDKAKLRAQIWDATVNNPMTTMPPFGKHGVLSEAEIDKVAEFVYGL